MTFDEIKTTTAKFRNETIKRFSATKDKLIEIREKSDDEAEDKALDELFLWKTAQVSFDTALSALIQLERLNDEYFGKVVKLRGN